MVYVGANDGMLHAFYAASDSMDSNGIVSSGGTSVTGGAEAWAYIPALVLPNLYLLADKSYLTQHQFFVDGNPIVGDICPNAPSSTCTSTQWKTILVGGLNDGGSGYYALDVTNPASPQALWEFTDANMGKSYGNPQITKLGGTGSLAGTWVVLLTSGYNNTSGDGKGHLYVLNANTGALITSIGTGGIISTGVGSAGTPSGLARISARVQTPSADNTALEVYGGDLLGNVWRFDINNNVGSSYANYEAQLLVTLKDASGNPQPITSKPEIGIVSNQLVVFVGTGKLLGVSDLTNTQVQTMYGIMDPLTVSTTAIPGTAIYASPQSSGSTCTSTITTNCFVQQTAVDTTCPSGTPTSICATGTPVRTGSNNAVNFPAQSGWYINFPDSGERDNTDPALALGTLGFVTNTPSSANSCSVGGYSYYWFLNYATGAPLATSTTGVISNEINPSAPAFSSGPVFFTLPPGSAGSNSGGSGKVLISTSSGNTMTQSANFSGSGGSTRRTSWRELFLQ
jgi:type IV pilus assembly protein PilY1